MSSKNKKFKIAIIGGGASGLSTAYELQKLNFEVDVYERSNHLGGLAGAVNLSKGRIDAYYHHLFMSDKYILNFLKDNHLDSQVKFKKTITGHIWNNKYYDISNIKNLKRSKLLSYWGLLRLLIGGAFIKYFPVSEKINFLSIYHISDKLFGKEAASKIWNPLIDYKFGKFAKFIPYSWLQKRIQDRTIQLGYLNKGFEVLYQFLYSKILSKKGNVFLNTPIKKIVFSSCKKKLLINQKLYDKAVITTSPKVNALLLKDVNYRSSKIEYLGALCGILEFDKRPIPSYWLGIADSNKKNKAFYKNFLAAISYAELDIDWNKSGLKTWPLYLVSYCTKKEFKKFSKKEWEEKMVKAAIELNQLSSLDAISEKNILNFKLSFAEYAQPILSPNKKLFPDPESADHCFFANMHNIFPNDRGQNRSFFLGRKIAKLIQNEFIKKY